MTVGFVGLLALVVAGCASGAEGVEAPASSSSARPSAEVAVEYVPASEPTPVAPVRASAEAIPTDPDLVASMECEPLSTDLLSQMRFEFGTPTRSVQVEVGEGLTPGEVWWVVVLDSPADDSYSWGIRRFLTNAPGGGGAWDWLAIQPRDPWANVLWDAQRLTRAQAALVKAERCLEG